MLVGIHRQASQQPEARAPVSEAQQLHDKCGVYTKPDIVNRILDAVSWTSKSKLFNARLLEPAAGNGAFIVEAADRLIQSCHRYGVVPKLDRIGGCIRSYELHAAASREARARLIAVLRKHGVHPATAAALARLWVTNGDFLLSNPAPQKYTHVVGNPPYVRWSKIPRKLQAAYLSSLPRAMTGGDLFLPFLDRGLEQLAIGGRCGFLCSDRWRFMAFAEGFRQKWTPCLDIKSEASILSENAFLRNVDAYPSILIATRRKPGASLASPTRKSANSLKERGYLVKVGPALGHTPAFVLDQEEQDVEAELLVPWVGASEIHEGKIAWEGRRVVTMHDQSGTLIDLKDYPLLRSRLKRFEVPLRQRSIVRNGAPWYRSIDKLVANGWKSPKLLIPELSKTPRIAIDRSGAIPSHGVYAIFAPHGDIDALYAKLQGGGLARALRGKAPQVKGGFVRCYKRFLDMIVLD